MWWCATGWVVPLCFDGLFWLHVHGQVTLLDCLTAHPETQCHIPENLYLLPDILTFIFKPRTNHYSRHHTSSSYNFIISFLLKNAFITSFFSQIQLAFQRAVVSHSPNPCICTATVHNRLLYYHVNGGSRSSWNNGIDLPQNTSSHPRRLQCLYLQWPCDLLCLNIFYDHI